MPPGSDSTTPDQQYTSMQQQAGLLPVVAVPPPVVFPGQISAMISMGGPGAAYSALPQMFPGNSFQQQGMMPQGMPPGMYGGNPYAMMGPPGPPSAFAQPYAAPPPMYAGHQGSHLRAFAPAAPAPMFDTPYGGQLAADYANDNRRFSGNAAYGGMAARVGGDMLVGGVGAAIGARFGGGAGAAVGGAIGMAAGEYFGAGQAAQNGFMDYVMGPSIQRRGLAAGIEHASQSFVPFGGSMHAGGGGFSHHASMEAAQGIMDLGSSASFRRETFDRFNTQDLAKITQSASHSGMMNGVTNPEEMVSRVRDIAKSVNAFMELAREPDLQRAIHTMGSLRSSGLNLSETLGAVQNGRSFARMAGTTFQELMDVGGGMGAQTFGAAGLSAGTGMRTGMANYGIAAASNNAGIINPAMMSMVGGTAGLAGMNNAFSANMLQMPMLAPGMMTANGGLNANALNGLMSGQSNLFSMTGRGSNVLGSMAGRHGIEGLGMAVAMQPYLQDQVGRMMQAQGPFAQRNMEDTQVMNLAQQMGMRGSAGFMTAAQAMGMTQSQALARATELSSPGYWQGQRQQLGVQMREARAAADRVREADRPTIMGTLYRQTALGTAYDAAGEAAFHATEPITNFFGGHHHDVTNMYTASTDSARRRMGRIARDINIEAQPDRAEFGMGDRLSTAYRLASARGGSGLVSALSAPIIAGNSTEAQLRDEANAYVRGGRFAGMLLDGGERAERSAARNMGRTFGAGAEGRAALADFSASVGRMGASGALGTQGTTGMVVNATVRAGASYLSDGLVDPGNVVGGAGQTGAQYREAFVNSMMRRRNMSREQANQIFSQHGEEIINQAAPMARLYMNADDRQRLRDAQQHGQALSTHGGATLRESREREAQGYRRIFGDGLTDRSTYNTAMDNVEGVGREGSRRYERSRYAISAMAMAAGVIEHGSSGNREAATRTLQRLQAQLGREGFSQEDIRNMVNRAQGMRDRFASGNGERTALAFVRNAGAQESGQAILDTFQQGDRERQEGQARQNVAAGYGDLRRGEGVLGRRFRDVTSENFNSNRARELFQQMDRGELTELSREGAFGRTMAEQIRRLQRGDRNAMGNINELMARRGEREQELRQEYTRRHSGSILTYNWWRDRLRSAAGQEEDQNRWVHNRLNAGSEGERNARRQMDESIATEQRARQAGIGTTGDANGRGGDALLTAAQELREVAHTFRDVVQGGNLDGLLNSGPTGSHHQ